MIYKDMQLSYKKSGLFHLQEIGELYIEQLPDITEEILNRLKIKSIFLWHNRVYRF